MNLKHLSKTISHALRHAPWLYELELDDEGWASVDTLLDSLGRSRRLRRVSASDEWRTLTCDDLARLIAASTKERFELEPDGAGGGRIRALYGHSLPGKLARVAARPPDALYHGTSPDTVPLIMAEGLRPMARQYVHLSVDVDTAREVGHRKARTPTILTISAADAHAAAVPFYRGNDHVWLADHVPPRFIAS